MDRFHGNGPYCKILTEKEPMRAQGLGLPYNKIPYSVNGSFQRAIRKSLQESARSCKLSLGARSYNSNIFDILCLTSCVQYDWYKERQKKNSPST